MSSIPFSSDTSPFRAYQQFLLPGALLTPSYVCFNECGQVVCLIFVSENIAFIVLFAAVHSIFVSKNIAFTVLSAAMLFSA